jgi:peptide/nickel transport system substrate-binding protein
MTEKIDQSTFTAVEDLMTTPLSRREALLRLGAGGLALSIPGLITPGAAKAAASLEASEERYVEGGILRLGSTAPIDSLNPYITISLGIGASIIASVYPTLVQYNADFTKIIGELATRWQIASSGRRITFHLRRGMKWSDGTPLTASDAAWTINTTVKFKDGATGNKGAQVAGIARAEAPNPSTLIVHYREPVGPALAKLTSLPILPKHVWSQYAQGNGAALKTYPNEPSGAGLVAGGPFTVTKYQQNELVIAQRNPNYYDRRPHIDSYGVQLYTAQDPALTGLKSGEIDLLNTLDPSPAINALKRSSQVVVVEVPGNVMHDFIFNSNPKKPQRRELLNPQVRLAFAHAINRRKIVEIAYAGHAQPATAFLPPSLRGWVPELEMEKFNIRQANRILNRLGYQRGSDGVRVAEGHKMSYEVLPAPILQGLGRRTFQIIQTDFAKIGVKLSAKFLDENAFWATLTAPDNKYMNYDLAMWDWVADPDPDFVMSVLTTQSWGAWSDSAFSSPTYDKLYEKQATTVSQAARKRTVKTMQEVLYRDRPYIMTTYLNQIFAHRRGWTGLTPSAFGPMYFLSKQGFLNVRKVA